MQEHQQLRRELGCLAAKADQMQRAVAEGLRLVRGETTGHMKDGALYVAERQHSMMVKGCDWPSAEAIGEFAAERAEVAARLRDMGMGDYAV